jgi:hypothetical protein
MNILSKDTTLHQKSIPTRIILARTGFFTTQYHCEIRPYIFINLPVAGQSEGGEVFTEGTNFEPSYNEQICLLTDATVYCLLRFRQSIIQAMQIGGAVTALIPIYLLTRSCILLESGCCTPTQGQQNIFTCMYTEVLRIRVNHLG